MAPGADDVDDGDRPVVLVVEDEPDLADLYAGWLSGDCEVRTAYDGEEALAAIDATVDVVLLDRRMPGLSGDEVLDRIRDRDFACRVAMVTAVEPNLEIIEMGFDDYVVKPVAEHDLHEVVEELHLRSTYDSQMQELFALASKKAVLDEELSEVELRASDQYARLEDRIAVLRTRIDRTVDEIADRDAYRRVVGDIATERTADDEG